MLTVTSVDEAMKGNDFWLHPTSDAARIVEDATRRGFIRRMSHTQVEWTEVGLAKARAELPAAICEVCLRTALLVERAGTLTTYVHNEATEGTVTTRSVCTVLR